MSNKSESLVINQDKGIIDPERTIKERPRGFILFPRALFSPSLSYAHPKQGSRKHQTHITELWHSLKREEWCIVHVFFFFFEVLSNRTARGTEEEGKRERAKQRKRWTEILWKTDAQTDRTLRSVKSLLSMRLAGHQSSSGFSSQMGKEDWMHSNSLLSFLLQPSISSPLCLLTTSLWIQLDVNCVYFSLLSLKGLEAFEEQSYSLKPTTSLCNFQLGVFPSLLVPQFILSSPLCPSLLSHLPCC